MQIASRTCGASGTGLAGRLTDRSQAGCHCRQASCVLQPASAKGMWLLGAGSTQTKARTKPKLTAANFKYFMRGAGEKAAAGDSIVAARRSIRLQPYDRFLRQFRYGDARISRDSSFRSHPGACCGLGLHFLAGAQPALSLSVCAMAPAAVCPNTRVHRKRMLSSLAAIAAIGSRTCWRCR